MLLQGTADSTVDADEQANNVGKGATGTRETRQVLGFTLKEMRPLEDFESRKDKVMFV